MTADAPYTARGPGARLRRPPRHRAVNPELFAGDVGALATFLSRAFGAVPVRELAGPGGVPVYAELVIDDSLLMIRRSGPGVSSWACSLALYTADVDETFRCALREGALPVAEPANQFYGHRTARVADPGGNHWTLHEVVEEPSAEEIWSRAAATLPRARRPN